MGARQAKNAPLYTKYEFDICHVRSLRGRLFDILDNQMEKNESEIQANKLKGCTGCREGSCSYFDFPSYPVGTPGASPGNYIPGQTISCTQHNTKQKYRKEIHSESHSQFTILNLSLLLIQFTNC